MKHKSPIVYVIDDDASIRSSLSRLFRVEGFDFECFATANQFLQLKKIKRPACIVSDIRMPGLNGLQLQDIIEGKGLHIPIIFITGHGEIPMSVRAIKHGAVDFLPKPFASETLIQSIRGALEKDARYLIQHRQSLKIEKRLRLLSEREREVLQGIVAGRLNKQIAHKMGISEKTVKVHRARVMQKMKASSVPHLVRLAEVVGIVAAIS